MKNLFYLLLLLPLVSFAQAENNTNISVISSERTSILYRGINNPIKIAVPNAKSFTASASGLTKIDSLGNYDFNVTGISGNEATIKIKAVMNDDSTLNESKIFEVRDVKGPIGLINGENCYNCIVLLTKEELRKGVISLGVNFPRNHQDIDETVTYFEIYFPKQKGFIVEGNTMNNKALKYIDQLKTGDIVEIPAIHYKFPGSENYRLRDPHPITIQIIEEKE